MTHGKFTISNSKVPIWTRNVCRVCLGNKFEELSKARCSRDCKFGKAEARVDVRYSIPPTIGEELTSGADGSLYIDVPFTNELRDCESFADLETANVERHAQARTGAGAQHN